MTVAIAGTVDEALVSATDAFAIAGIDSPRLDAELLLAAATGAGRERLVTAPEEGVTAPAARSFGAMVRRRIAREPVAYILARKGFRRIELAVDRRVLIPRPESEGLVDVALELAPQTVLDVGTGSGAIALAIADELPGAKVVATDTSLDALAVAQVNRERLGLAERVQLEYGTLPAAGSFDLLVANLPYVSEGEWERLPPEIRSFEPREALTPGPTGFEAFEALLGELALGGLTADAVALEVGEGQAATVGELIRRAEWGEIEVRPDLAGIDRIVLGR